MQVVGVIIETDLPTEQLQRESDRVGNGFLHSDTEDGRVYIEDRNATDGGFLMNLWLISIKVKEQGL